MAGLRYLAIAAAFLCFNAIPAAAFKKCKMPDGKLMFVDVPPPGCVVEDEIENSTNPPEREGAPSDDVGGGEPTGQASAAAGDAQAITMRRRLERDLNEAGEELTRLRQELANAPKVPPGIYINTRDGSATYQEKERVRPDLNADIQARETALQERIQGLKDEFATLTRNVAERHGGRTPAWWSPSPRCDRCP